jgi:hypothetical protein
MIVNQSDVYNFLNIELESELGVGGQPNASTVITQFLEDCHADIFDFIAMHAYGGHAQVRRYMQDCRYRGALKSAILEQIRFIVANPDVRTTAGIMMQNGVLYKLTPEERITASISPKAMAILANSGLLYGGRV